MQAFEYASPATLKEAVALLGGSWTDSAVLAGGTDLLSLMKDYVMSPKRVVNIKNIDLGNIAGGRGGLRVGATVTLDELASNAQIRNAFPSLHAAAMGVTSPQIRNMGTVGGDLCQRPRCWYFRQGNGLLAMKDGRSLIDGGENKYHAIFPMGNAKFVSASSFGPPLIALNAKIKIAGPGGVRELEAAKFFVAPKSDANREIALAANEIVTEVTLPAAGIRNATYEVRHKDALDWPLVTASVAIGKDYGRVVLGHVGPAPVWAEEASKLAAQAGLNMTEAQIQQVSEASVKGAQPLSQNAYKVHLAKVAVARALREALKKA